MSKINHQLELIENKINQNVNDGKIIREYNPDFCKSIIIHGAYGNSPDNWCGSLNIPPSLIDEWREEYPDFNDSYEIAIVKQAYYCEKQLASALTTNDTIKIKLFTDMLDRVYKKTPVSNTPRSIYKSTGKRKSYSQKETSNIVNDFDEIKNNKKD